MMDQGLARDTRSFLTKGHSGFFEEVGVDFSLLLALSKKDTFEVTCLKFSKKYGMDYRNFYQVVEQKREQSKFDMDYFEMKDDLMDWEFAEAAKVWWMEKIQKLSVKA